MTDRLGIYSEVELEGARQLVRHCIRAVRSARLYQPGHPNLEGLMEQLRKRWEQATQGGPLSLQLTSQAVLLEGEVVYQATAGNDVLPTALYEHGVVGLVLKRGLEPEEEARLIGVLARENEPSADYAALLWEADLKHVQIILDSGESGADAGDPGEFARRLGTLAQPGDPTAAPDYDEQREEIGAAARPAALPEPERDVMALGEGERAAIARILESDTYVATVRHAGRVVHLLARESLTPEEASGLERALQSIVGSTIASGDLPGANELLDRAEAMLPSARGLEVRVAEATLHGFREPSALRALLETVELQRTLDTRELAGFVRRIGPDAVPALCAWMVESEHAADAANALSLFGAPAAAHLAALYQKSSRERRDRVAPALLRIGTPEALSVLASDFLSLAEAQRQELVDAVSRANDSVLRPVLVQALRDVSERIRRSALGALRRSDAPMVASVLSDMLDPGFMGRDDREVRDFYEALARIGESSIAAALAAECVRGGLARFLRGLTPAQKLSVRALRRMRAPEARAVVEELRRNGPRPVREALDDPLGDLD